MIDKTFIMSTEEENIMNTEEEKEYFEHYRIVADPKQQPLRLDKFLVNRIERTTRNRVQNAISSGAVRVNDKQVKSNYKVRPGDTITVVLPKPLKTHEIIPENIPLNVVFEDKDLLVINKPPGLVVHPGIGNRTGTLVNALAYHFKHLPIMEGNEPDRPGIVHRIDKNTSGLMVIAKSEFAMSHLAKQFFDHTIQRRYVAIVWSEPHENEGILDLNIGRHERNRIEMATYPKDGDIGKVAITHFKVLERLYYVSLVECKLETGRTHQIRVHMKYNGNPVFNDERYGGNRIMKGTVYSKYRRFVENCFDLLPRQGLHAKSLGFIHPTTGEEMFFESDLPEDMQKCLDKWRNYLDGRKTL